MPDQVTTLTYKTKVPVNATLVLTTAVKEWQFKSGVWNKVVGTVEAAQQRNYFDIQLWCTDTNWFYGTSADTVTIPVTTEETLTVRVTNLDSIFVRAAAGSGTLVSLYVD